MLGAASTGAERPTGREHRSAAATTQTGPAVGFVRHSSGPDLRYGSLSGQQHGPALVLELHDTLSLDRLLQGRP